MKGAPLRALSALRDRYFTVDARTLALFRVFFGLHLIANVYDRTRGPDAIAFYTNAGVLPNHYALFAPMGERIWSLLFPFSTPLEVQAAFVFILLVYAAYTLGYRTKLAQIMVVICLVSLDNRNLALQNGGVVVTNLVAIWTAFLPLGARFSIDHLRRSLAERRERDPAELGDRAAMIRAPAAFARIAVFGIVANFAIIYLFNCLHKRGGTWRDGSAVHWVLWQNRIATVFAAWLRLHEPAWFSPLATRGTLFIEAALPGLLLFPFFRVWAKRAALLGIWALHCGISLMMTLGPFSYSMMAFSLLLVSREDWELARRVLVRPRPEVFVVYDPSSPWHHRAARILARLDPFQRLQFVDGRAPEGLPREVEARLEGRPWIVIDARGGAPASGARGMARAVRALPCGALFAWPLAIGAVASAADAVVDNRSALPRDAALSTEDGPPRDPAKVPARRLARSVTRVFGEALAAAFVFIAGVQIGNDNWAIPDPIRLKSRPDFVHQIVDYLRVPQGWSMFSPEAPRDDGTVVIDAVLTDGRHLDPRKQAPPDFDAALHGPWFDDQQWCDWDLRMRFDGNRHLYPYFRDYIARLDQLGGWKQSASIRSFDVFWVNNAAPPPGSTRPFNITKQLLFSSTAKP